MRGWNRNNCDRLNRDSFFAASRLTPRELFRLQFAHEEKLHHQDARERLEHRPGSRELARILDEHGREKLFEQFIAARLDVFTKHNKLIFGRHPRRMRNGKTREWKLRDRKGNLLAHEINGDFRLLFIRRSRERRPLISSRRFSFANRLLKFSRSADRTRAVRGAWLRVGTLRARFLCLLSPHFLAFPPMQDFLS